MPRIKLRFSSQSGHPDLLYSQEWVNVIFLHLWLQKLYRAFRFGTLWPISCSYPRHSQLTRHSLMLANGRIRQSLTALVFIDLVPQMPFPEFVNILGKSFHFWVKLQLENGGCYRNWPRYGLRWSGWYCNPEQHELCRPSQRVLFRIAVPTTTAQTVYVVHFYSTMITIYRKSKGNLGFDVLCRCWSPSAFA